MNYSYLIPNWFFGFDIAMEILFAVITFITAVMAFKINSVTKERKIKLFGIAFLLISLSYIVLGGLNFWFVNLVSSGFRQVTIDNVQLIGVVSLYLYMVLFASGLITLAYINCDVKKGKIYYLLFGLGLLVIAASLHKLITFRILSVFLLSFISYHYFEEYLKNKNKKAFWSLIAFSLLFLSCVDFIFSPFYYQAYVIGHLLEL